MTFDPDNVQRSLRFPRKSQYEVSAAAPLTTASGANTELTIGQVRIDSRKLRRARQTVYAALIATRVVPSG